MWILVTYLHLRYVYITWGNGSSCAPPIATMRLQSSIEWSPIYASFPHVRPLSWPANITSSLVCTWGFQNKGCLVHSIIVSEVCLSKCCRTWHHARKMEFTTLSSGWQAILGGTPLVQHQFKESGQDLPYLGIPSNNLLRRSTFQHPLPGRRHWATILASNARLYIKGSMRPRPPLSRSCINQHHDT